MLSLSHTAVFWIKRKIDSVRNSDQKINKEINQRHNLSMSEEINYSCQHTCLFIFF